MKSHCHFFCIAWLCMVLITGYQAFPQEKSRSSPDGTKFSAKVTDEDGTVFQVNDLNAVYEPAEWVDPRPQTKRPVLSLVLQNANGKERLIEIPFAEIKRIDFEETYSDPKLTGSVPIWYPVRIAKHDGSYLLIARGPKCDIHDAAGRIVESIPLSDERKVYDRSNGYAGRGYVFRSGSQSGVTGIGLSNVSKPILLKGFAGYQAGKSFYIQYKTGISVKSIEFY
jgi:hypothetical protein